ncbi:multidrug resistance-associated ABC transporter [Artomyces pyxidatus]|uniref:Multidrug resistance-associated ABC transporter n=1 Tax=Artomyces pyxidatus TaxID=48021 RepID=A0ACB8TEB9_9AGAM|nr:multidrug resistance-associated ABC transporter [Artomyces pyxidatus]
MARFQLATSIVLASSVGVSLAFLWLLKPREGKVQLPITAEDEVVPTHDPFDVTTPEDVKDGEPIDEEGFWARIRFNMMVLSLLFSIILAVQATSLTYAIYLSLTSSITVYVLHLVFAAYLICISVRSLTRDASSSHTETMVHISALTFLAFATLGTTALIPENSISMSEEAAPQVLNVLWYVAFALYTCACLLAITTPLGPALHYPTSRIYSEKTVAAITNTAPDNVSGVTGASVWDTLLFSYTTKVVMLGSVATSLDIGDLPIVPGNMRATSLFKNMRRTLRTVFLKKFLFWDLATGSGWELAYRLIRVNAKPFATQISLAFVSAFIFYGPPWFLRRVVLYLEEDPLREDRRWGWFYSIGMFVSTATIHIVVGQLWSISTTTLQVSIKVQLNSILFAKTLVRKDVASSAAPTSKDKDKDKAKTAGTSDDAASDKKEDEDDFSSKAQIMTLMTTDVDRVSEFGFHLFTLVDAPIEICIGTFFLYSLLGVSAFFGLAMACLFLPLNHYAGKVVVGAQDNLMKARDERVALMNEILGAIRMLKFMAWERSFEKRVLQIRSKELKYQKLNYAIEVLWNAIWSASPILVTLVAFFHFAVIRKEVLTPSIAFTSVLFTEMKFALNALPETLINMLQSLVSLRRIEKYLHGAEVNSVPPLGSSVPPVAFQGATVTWPQDRARSRTGSSSATASASATPKNKFILIDLNLQFPKGELSLVCGKLGSGKTLLLLALLGEADFLTGQVLCPRTPHDAIASFVGVLPKPEEWIVDGVCAYVPQSAWLRNASIKAENILFNLPFDPERYQRTLEVCALVSDLKILEDGDESEIGERGVNLSGGQKARVSLARAVYSRASILLLDDVLSAVDAHTAHHLYYECLKGDLMRGRTVVLVSHHVQLCSPGASYIVALDNGRVLYQGDREGFQTSGVLSGLVQSGAADPTDKAADVEEVDAVIIKTEHVASGSEPASDTSSTAVTTVDVKVEKKAPRKLVEEEARAVGRISRDVWTTYIRACGGMWYWLLFGAAMFLAAAGPVAENGWLSIWSGASESGHAPRTPLFYIGIYAAVSVILTTFRFFVLYMGSIHASHVLYQRLLENVLFAKIRFHDTVSRGRLLNRFGKDFEGIDSSLSDNFGRSIINGLSVVTTLITITYVGGPPFFLCAVLIGTLYFNDLTLFSGISHTRIDSVTRSPLYSIYGETISGVTIIRAFGASSKFLRDMLRCVDTNTSPFYWMWGVNRWLSVRFNLLSAGMVGITALVAILTPRIDAALAGFMLAFASTISPDVRRFVSLEQSMVALERVKEYSELQREPAEFVEPRPPASWPTKGEIECEGLVIRYAPELPDVLHDLNFSIKSGEKVGILGRTGSGKSTLALSFFRFVEATEGTIRVDGIDISKVGLTDLRSKLTIIPQDPTILSGTLRSTLDVFNEYEDSEIYEALRRVHLIPSEDTVEEDDEGVNVNVFRDLDSSVSEGGENFSTGEKQLLCMARAILKRSRVLVMDEATASVDYATDELISKTIRHEFADSTILTIAHRLRTVIDYNRVMLLDEGRIVEFDSPATLLSDSNSKFYALCKATGKDEFAVLKKMAGVS